VFEWSKDARSDGRTFPFEEHVLPALDLTSRGVERRVDTLECLSCFRNVPGGPAERAGKPSRAFPYPLPEVLVLLIEVRFNSMVHERHAHFLSPFTDEKRT
jgi:hypothetical protein